MPKTAAATRVDMASTSFANRATVVGGQTVRVELIFDGVQAKGEDIFDALEAKYGAGKVTSDVDTASQHQYRLRIRP